MNTTQKYRCHSRRCFNQHYHFTVNKPILVLYLTFVNKKPTSFCILYTILGPIYKEGDNSGARVPLHSHISSFFHYVFTRQVGLPGGRVTSVGACLHGGGGPQR